MLLSYDPSLAWILKQSITEPPQIQVVIYLKETGSERVSVTEFRSENTFHRYQVIRMWEQDPEVFLRDPEVLPLAVLARAESPEGLVQRAAREVEQVEDRKRQSDLAACAEMLGGLRFSKELLRGLFREETVKESVIYQEILQEGIQEGSQEKARTIAVKMLAEGMNVALIARVTDMTPKQIEDLRNGSSR